MRVVLTWMAAAASPIGLLLTMRSDFENLSFVQIAVILIVLALFVGAAIFDIKEDWRKSAKTYPSEEAINEFMYSMLLKSGRCEICSRNASWISDKRIYRVLMEKSRRGDLTFLVEKITPELEGLKNAGAEIIEYGRLGFEPLTRFTIVNAGNHPSSYVAIGKKNSDGVHTIEKLDVLHPTYFMAGDLIRSIRIANVKFKEN